MVIEAFPARVDATEGPDTPGAQPIPVPIVPTIGDEARSGPPAPGVAAVALAAVMVVSVMVVFLGLFAFTLSGLQEQRSQHQRPPYRHHPRHSSLSPDS